MDSDQHTKRGQYHRDGQLRDLTVQGLGKSYLCMKVMPVRAGGITLFSCLLKEKQSSIK